MVKAIIWMNITEKKEKSIFDNIITCLIARGIYFDLCRDNGQIEKMT